MRWKVQSKLDELERDLHVKASIDKRKINQRFQEGQRRED
jgi:hypothetical protein